MRYNLGYTDQDFSFSPKDRKNLEGPSKQEGHKGTSNPFNPKVVQMNKLRSRSGEGPAKVILSLE